MDNWMRRFWSRETPRRETGLPQSANGASSLHLWWDLPVGDRFTAASVTLEITQRPDVDRLVFFALQVAFIKPGGGGAHLGLQHNPRFPFNSAANWGGYDPHGGFLKGTESPLPSTPNDANTRDFVWHAGASYRLAVTRGEERGDGWHAWEGTITDLGSGVETVVRRLWSAGDFLRAPVVWTENFAPCDADSFQARWSNATVLTDDGKILPVSTMRTDYQAFAAGGCTNTDAAVEGSTFVQTTAVERTTKPGAALTVT
ncbi:MAG: hypothetical protein ABFR53_10625 [Actinomycetota bacterium]